MKKFTLLITLLLFVVCSFAQKITRGPDVGEIYFLGPTTTILQGAVYYCQTIAFATSHCHEIVEWIRKHSQRH
jgi:hypothetical protein